MKQGTALAALLLAASISTWIWAVALGLTRPDTVSPFSVVDAVWGISFLAFPIVGAILASKRPNNAIGWLFLIGPTFVGIGILLYEVVGHQQADASSWTQFLADAFFYLGLSLMAGFFLGLFPSGRFHSRRWASLGFLATTGIIAILGWTMMRSCSTAVLQFPSAEAAAPSCTDPIEPWFIRFENPLGLTVPPGGSVWDTIGGIGAALVIAAMIGGAASLFARHRQGTPTERHQLRWLLAVLLVAVPLFGVLVVAEAFGTELDALSLIVTFTVLIGIPTAIGFAILRHQLLDIDRFISRTATFTVVAVMLVVVYAFMAVWLPTALTGGSSSLAVAASTLAVAALFNPVRRRVQRFMDRRFDRTPYNAELVGSDLARQLRDNVDANQISRDWMDGASGALRPVTASVWVRQPPN